MSSEAGDGSQENLAHRGLADDEPLLGRRGDASQPEDHRMFKNLWLGMLDRGLRSRLKTSSLADSLKSFRHCHTRPSRNMDRMTAPQIR